MKNESIVTTKNRVTKTGFIPRPLKYNTTITGNPNVETIPALSKVNIKIRIKQ
jgi:hypothetical protein